GADAPVAEVDGERIGRNGLALLQRYAALDGRAASSAAVLAEVVEQRALARYAAAHLSREQLFPDAHVAFAPEVAADDKLTGLLRAVYREPLETALRVGAGAELQNVLVATPPPTAAQLREVLGDPAQVRLDYALDAAAQRKAQALVVQRWRGLDGREAGLSLADVYARQNVQGRLTLHRLDADFLLAEARRRVAALLVQDWARTAAGDAAIAELRRNLLDREYAQGLASHYGVGADPHDSNAYVDGLRRAVTPAQVAAWYAAHREQFRRVERVKARHIRVADEAAAQQVAAQLRKDGSNFAALARRHSLAPDATGGGELGWLARRAEADWFTELVFAQPVRRNGVPVREPVAADAPAHWEIVRVDVQQTGYFPADSETVRYLAARAIAEQAASRTFAELRERLKRETVVRHADARIAATASPAVAREAQR
uniref:peptidyl-prolyl cis-trans isomerase n=1 Tax=Tahibacter caeni TaxID=1453545 RepID=UPI0021481033